MNKAHGPVHWFPGCVTSGRRVGCGGWGEGGGERVSARARALVGVLWLQRASSVALYSVKRDLLQCQKRPTTVSKETYYSVKRDPLQCQKRPTTVSKETYYSVKRDQLQCQKRPTTVSKEIYYSVKRDLLQCQKRPTTVSKETYYSVKRDLLPYHAGRSSAAVVRILSSHARGR